MRIHNPCRGNYSSPPPSRTAQRCPILRVRWPLLRHIFVRRVLVTWSSVNACKDWHLHFSELEKVSPNPVGCLHEINLLFRSLSLVSACNTLSIISKLDPIFEYNLFSVYHTTSISNTHLTLPSPESPCSYMVPPACK